jgi:hypothetical protein
LENLFSGTVSLLRMKDTALRENADPVAWGWAMAYYKVRIEVWCDWNPAESDLDDIIQAMGVGEAICTTRKVIAVVDRPKDIEDEEAMSFFGGEEGDADESQG